MFMVWRTAGLFGGVHVLIEKLPSVNSEFVRVTMLGD